MSRLGDGLLVERGVGAGCVERLDEGDENGVVHEFVYDLDGLVELGGIRRERTAGEG